MKDLGTTPTPVPAGARGVLRKKGKGIDKGKSRDKGSTVTGTGTHAAAGEGIAAVSSHSTHSTPAVVDTYAINAKDSLLRMPHHHSHAKFPGEGQVDTGYVSYFPVRFLLQLSGMVAGKYDSAPAAAAAAGSGAGNGGKGERDNEWWCQQEPSEEVTTLVVGPGAWDLDYAPLRDFMRGGVRFSVPGFLSFSPSLGLFLSLSYIH